VHDLECVISMCLSRPSRNGFRPGFEANVRNLLTIIAVVFMSSMHIAQAQPVTVDPESIVPLPDKFDIEMPAADVPPKIARFHGAWVGTWADDNRHILVVERVKPDGRADVVFAHADSAYYNMYREWFRSEAKIADGVLTFPAIFTAASVTLRFAFEGPDRLYETATYRQNGRAPASACRFLISRFARPMARGRSCSKRRSTRLSALARRRSRSYPTGPTPAGISLGPGRHRLRRIGFATRDLPCWC
jgi:hypothetical protein